MARLQDSRGQTSPLDAQGWIYADRLRKPLRVTQNRLYVSLHRARKEIEALGAVEGAQLVERRATTHQLRLGTSDVRIDAL